jgi:hypothetical protein
MQVCMLLAAKELPAPRPALNDSRLRIEFSINTSIRPRTLIRYTYLYSSESNHCCESHHLQTYWSTGANSYQFEFHLKSEVSVAGSSSSSSGTSSAGAAATLAEI